MSLLDEIRKKSEVEFRPASLASIEQLRSIGVPEDALAFYRSAEPVRCAEINSVRLWPIVDILGENKDYVPGCYIQPFGYVVFATTVFGDAFCFDRNSTNTDATAPVVLMAHDWDWDSLKREDIDQLPKPIAGSFEGFLGLYAAEKLDIQPNYPKVDL